MNRRNQYGNHNSKYSNRSTGITYAQAVRKREMLIEEISSLVAQKLARDGQYYLNESNQELLEEGIFDTLKTATLAGLLALGGMTGQAQSKVITPAGKVISADISATSSDTIKAVAPQAASELKRLGQLTKRVIGTGEVMHAIATIEGLDLSKEEDRIEYETVVKNYENIGKDRLTVASPSFEISKVLYPEDPLTGASRVQRASQRVGIIIEYDLAADSVRIGTREYSDEEFKLLTSYSDQPGYSKFFQFVKSAIDNHVGDKVAELLSKSRGVELAKTGKSRQVLSFNELPSDTRGIVSSIKRMAGSVSEDIKDELDLHGYLDKDAKLRDHKTDKLIYRQSRTSVKNMLLRSIAQAYGLNLAGTGTQKYLELQKKSGIDFMTTIEKIMADLEQNIKFTDPDYDL